jgi:hypothetical protein
MVSNRRSFKELLSCNVPIGDVDELESTNEHFHLLFLLKFAEKHSYGLASNKTLLVIFCTEILPVVDDVICTVGGTQKSNKTDWELI